MIEEVLGWGEIAKGLVRPCVIEAMGEGVDTELEGFEAGREVFDAVELVSPRALGAFDVAVELGPLRRQDEEAQVALSACVLELGPELRPLSGRDRSPCRARSRPGARGTLFKSVDRSRGLGMMAGAGRELAIAERTQD